MQSINEYIEKFIEHVSSGKDGEFQETEFKTDDRNEAILMENITGLMSKYSELSNQLGNTVARSQAVLDTMLDALIVIDDKGIIQSANLAVEHTFGYKADEIIGKNIKMLMPEPYHSEHDGYLKNYKNTGKKKVIGIGREVTAKKKDGTEFPALLAVGEIKFGKDILYTGTLKDISKQKEAERELSERNKALEEQAWFKSELSNVSNAAQLSKNLMSMSKNVLSQIAKIFEIGHGVFYIRVTDDNGNYKDEFKLCGTYAFNSRKNLSNTIRFEEGIVGQSAYEKSPILLTNVPSDFTHVTSALGEALPKNILAQPILFENEVLGMIEISTFKNLEEKQTKLMKEIGHSLGLVLNTIMGREKAEKLLEELRAASETERLLEELRVANEEMLSQQEEMKVQQEALQETNNELEKSRCEIGESNLNLQKQTEELEKQRELAETRSHEIEKAREIVEKKAAELELSNKYKSEFLANMSHELRTPLNSLLILSDTLAANDEENLTSEQVEAAKIINGGGKDLLSLIEDILDLSKVEAGKLDVFIDDVCVDYITLDLKRQFDPVANQKGLDFIIDNQLKSEDVLHTDQKRVGQILKNLLSNAFKFTEKGSVTLKIERPGPEVALKQSHLNKENSVICKVTDTGVGIDHDKLGLIFEAFQQEDGSVSRKYGGTGLGLSISRELAKMLSCELQLESEKGKGSTFSLIIPTNAAIDDSSTSDSKQEQLLPKEVIEVINNTKSITPTEPEITTEQSVVEKAHSPNNILDDSKTILIVEDDEAFADILKDRAEKRGYKAHTSSNGQEALQMAKEILPSVISIDIGLPDINGRDLLKDLKSAPLTSSIPVYIISGHDNLWDYYQDGAVGVLRKPASNSKLDVFFDKLESIYNNEPRKILVVEDDELSQKVIDSLISNPDIEQIQASTGQEALELIKGSKQNFDVIILDLMLPDMTGLDILKELKALEQPIEIPPVIFYTAKSIEKEEYADLKQFSSSFVLKGAESADRLRDELSIFTHIDLRNKNTSSKITTSDDEPAVEIAANEEPADSAENVFSGKRVLLVDDDLRNTFALSGVLRKHGLEVDMADNGKLALEKLRLNKNIDLVIMDIMMPIMDGYEAIDLIRKDADLAHLPIIALSAKTLEEDQRKAIGLGANDYLIKPVDVENLLTTASKWLSETLEKKVAFGK